MIKIFFFLKIINNKIINFFFVHHLYYYFIVFNSLKYIIKNLFNYYYLRIDIIIDYFILKNDKLKFLRGIYVFYNFYKFSKILIFVLISITLYLPIFSIFRKLGGKFKFSNGIA